MKEVTRCGKGDEAAGVAAVDAYRATLLPTTLAKLFSTLSARDGKKRKAGANSTDEGEDTAHDDASQPTGATAAGAPSAAAVPPPAGSSGGPS